MLKWFLSLVMALLLAGSALAGVPFHSGERKCPMMWMEDCCLKAESQSVGPQAAAARLCCALNCNLPGTTGPTSLAPGAPSATTHLLAAALIPAARLNAQRSLLAGSSPQRNQHSPPFYLQHLALLI